MAEDEKIYEDRNIWQEHQAWRAEIRGLVRERYEDVALQRKDTHDHKLRGESRKFNVGDLVLVLDKTKTKTKFDPRWRGPFLVIENDIPPTD